VLGILRAPDCLSIFANEPRVIARQARTALIVEAQVGTPRGLIQWFEARLLTDHLPRFRTDEVKVSRLRFPAADELRRGNWLT